MLLVDDDEIVRTYLSKSLAEHGELEIVTFTGQPTPDAVIRDVHDTAPDLLLVDLHLGSEVPDAIMLFARLHEVAPALPVVVFTADTSAYHAARAMEAGVPTYVDKSWLLEHAEDVGVLLRMTNVDRRLYFVNPTFHGAEEGHPLTPKQRSVLELYAQGCTRSVIARKLAISARTVDTYRTQLLSRLNVSTIDEAVWVAKARGLLG